VKARPLPPFVVVSLALHAAAFGLALRAASAVTAAGPAFDETARPLAGETLDVDPSAESEPEPDPADPTPSLAEIPSPARLASQRAPGLGAPAAGGAAPSSAASRPALFGAVGVRYATDLATSFTRAFPQAASADAVWIGVPFGSAGTADLSLALDAGGHLTGHAIAGAPSPALRRGIERTLALLGPRAFTAHGPVTRLRISARVARDDLHDGLHGDVFALSGGSFSGQVGTAFFALPPSAGPGRRIDVELRLLP
jgi:hypothetical protein